MKTKARKTSSANLESKRPIFFALGLAMALSMAYFALEYEVVRDPLRCDFPDASIPVEEVVFVPLTFQKTPKAPKTNTSVSNTNPSTTQFAVVSNTFAIPTINVDHFGGDDDDGFLTVEPVKKVDEQLYTFTEVENMPVFEGCEDAVGEKEKMQCMNEKLFQFVGKNFKVTEQMANFSTGEKVFVQFVIEKDGKVRQAEIVRGTDELVANEAVRVVKRLPKFTPAKINGNPVRMSYILPVNVRLQ